VSLIGLEVVDIDEPDGQRPVSTVIGDQQRGQAIEDQLPIRQSSQRIVQGGVFRRERSDQRGADGAKHDHCSDDGMRRVVDWRRRVFNRRFVTVTADEQALRGKRNRDIPGDGLLQRTRHTPTGDGIDQRQHSVDRLPKGGRERPAREDLGRRIEIRHCARRIGADDGVGDRIECRLGKVRHGACGRCLGHTGSDALAGPGVPRRDTQVMRCQVRGPRQPLIGLRPWMTRISTIATAKTSSRWMNPPRV
jgi:hypothetical protein